MIKRVVNFGLMLTLVVVSLMLLIPNYTVWTVVVNAVLGLVLGVILLISLIHSFSNKLYSLKELDKMNRLILFLVVVFTANLLLLFFSLKETLAEGKSMIGTTLLSVALFIAVVGQMLARKNIITRVNQMKNN